MASPRTVPLPDGRRLSFDDVGDPAGQPVLYLHGTPDCRLARHPDDGLAAASGVRLLAIDRPGAGGSDPNPTADLTSLGQDLVHLLDALELDRAGVLAWSSGGLLALGAATVLGSRATALTLVGAVPPVEAYEDPAVVAALGPARRPFVELALELDGPDLAVEVAPYLVPDPLDADLALAHVLESAGERGRSELAAVPGAAEQMARALAGSVEGGRSGLVHDIELQLTPGLDLSAVTAPVLTVHGTEDQVSPPEVGRWLERALPHATAEVVPDASHHLLFPQWERLLRATTKSRTQEP